MLQNFSERAGAVVRAHRRLFTAALLALSLVTWAAVGASAWFIRDVVTGLPDETDVREIATMAQSTTLLDRNGEPAFTIFKEQRIEVPLERVSPHLIRAILAVEDQRFYDHGGLDIVRVAGAALENLREGRTVEGGSTITQQLARQSFLTPEKTYRRKLKEVIVARQIEGEFEKNEILELYLNKVYFGDGLYGVEAASLGYFGKHAADVDVAEAALLAGLVKSPSRYAPTVNMDRAVERRKVVLQAMRNAGVIDGNTFAATVDAPVALNDTLRKEEPFGQYFKEEVRKQLVERFGWERVYEGGLRVHTTLDLDLQKAAEAEVARGLEEIEKRQLRRARRDDDAAEAEKERLQAALVAMDPKTGEVLAMVGGRDFAESRFNRVTQADRQPGSAFKPFVYAAAIERGFSPATVLANLNEPVQTPEGPWVPEDEHSSGSSMTMRTALRTSSNRAAVRMIREVGIAPAVKYAERFGVGEVPPVPSLALGSGEVTLMSMTAGFAAFANEGMRPQPRLIRRVETLQGEVLYSGGPSLQRTVSEATAYIMSTMLADVIDSGTGAGVRSHGFRLPAAGKTGTTNEYRDAWFVGYTPNVVTGVWVGYDMPQTIVRNGYAARLAVPMWARFMATATKGHARDWYEAPPTVARVTICLLSGRRATDACRNRVSVDENGYLTTSSTAYTDYFVRGTEPSGYCHLHDRYDDHPRAVATSGRTSAAPDPEPESSSAGIEIRREPRPEPRERARREREAEDEPLIEIVSEDAAAAAEPDAAQAEAQPEAAEPRERRSFWRRIFRLGPNP